jgi:hypothetical protein
MIGLFAAAQPLPAQNPVLADAGPNSTAASLALYRPFAALHDEAVHVDASSAALPLPSYGPWVGYTKWATLAMSAGFAVLGFALHNKADEDFARLNLLCQVDPDDCRNRNPDGSYQNPRLEDLYQSSLDKDQQARFALLFSEITFATSVVLFIVDFQKKDKPHDIPYDPDAQQAALRVSAVPGEIVVRYYF